MQQDQLSIKITGRDDTIPAPSFLAVVFNIVKILRDVDAAVSEENRPTLRWDISRVSMNSPLLLDLAPSSVSDADNTVDNSREILVACTRGLREIQESDETVPRYFRERTLSSARRVVNVLNDGIRAIEIFTPYSQPLLLSQKLAANVDRLLAKSYVDYGTFEGRLASISIRGRQTFRIEDEIYGYVACSFTDELLAELKNNLFGERVSVFGETRYSASGQPMSVRVEQIQRLRRREELPQFDDLEGINFDMSGGFDLDLSGSFSHAE